MTRQLLRSAAFLKAAKKIVKRNAQLAPRIEATLELLANDAFDPAFKLTSFLENWPAPGHAMLVMISGLFFRGV